MKEKIILEFETKFINVISLIDNKLLDDLTYKYYDLSMSVDSIYSDLSKNNIQKWLELEIVTMYDLDERTKTIFDSQFTNLYNKSCLKFDLIEDFLQRNKKKDIELSNEIYKMFLHYVEKNDIYTPLKIISSLIFHTKKDQKMINLIEDCLPFLKEIEEYDRTILFTIVAFVTSTFDSDELNEIKKKSLYF